MASTTKFQELEPGQTFTFTNQRGIQRGMAVKLSSKGTQAVNLDTGGQIEGFFQQMQVEVVPREDFLKDPIQP